MTAKHTLSAALVLLIVAAVVWLASARGPATPDSVGVTVNPRESGTKPPSLETTDRKSAAGAGPTAGGAQEEGADATAATSPARPLEGADASALVLSPRDVSGRIVDGNGDGVSGVRIICKHRDKSGIPASGADGVFHLKQAGTVNGIVELSFRDVPAHFLRPKSIRVLATQEPIVIRLQPALTISGRVIAPAGIDYASLRLSSQDAELNDSRFSRSTKLAGDGRFVIGHLSQDARLRIFCLDVGPSRPAQLRPAVIDDVPAGTVGLEIVMATGHVLEGTGLNADGTPYAAKQVILVPESMAFTGGSAVLSQEDGSFRFTGLAPGRYYAGLTGSKGIQLISARTRLTVPGPPLRLSVGTGPRVRVRLRPPPDEEGEIGLDSFIASMASGDAPWHMLGYTFGSDEQGVFKIPVTPGSVVNLYIRKEGTPWYASVRGLRWRDGQIDVTLAKGLRIEGRVLDIDGKPLRGGGHVDLVLEEFAPHTAIRPDGSFTLQGVPPGKHTLRAHPEHSNLALWEHDIEAGRTDVVLRLH